MLAWGFLAGVSLALHFDEPAMFHGVKAWLIGVPVIHICSGMVRLGVEGCAKASMLACMAVS